VYGAKAGSVGLVGLLARVEVADHHARDGLVAAAVQLGPARRLAADGVPDVIDRDDDDVLCWDEPVEQRVI